MPVLFRTASLALLILSTAGAAGAQECGGDFGTWKQALRSEAAAAGVGPAGLAALDAAQIDEKVLQRDRAQGVFRQTFLEFSGRMISDYRLKQGRAKLKEHAEVFARADREFGVQPAVITAFWALETDFGAVQGDFIRSTRW